MREPEGFYVQDVDGNLDYVPIGTQFSLIQSDTDPSLFIVMAVTDADTHPVIEGSILFTGSEDQCRDYLSLLPGTLAAAGLPVVFTQSVTPEQQPDAEDATRWGNV